MAIKRVWVGSVGPFLYDDARNYAGTVEPVRGVYSDGTVRGKKIISDDAPVAPTEVVRLVDLGGTSGVPNIQDMTASRSFGTVYQNTTTQFMIVMVSADLES